MKRSLIFVLFLTSPALAQFPPQTPDSKFPEQIKKVELKKESPTFDSEADYSAMLQACVDQGRIVVVFVGHRGNMTGRNKSKVQTFWCSVEKLDGYPTKCIVIGASNGKSVVHKATLEWNATDDQLTDAISGRKAVSQSAVPFRSALRPGEVQTADVEEQWPVGLAFLNDLEPYTTAQRVQKSGRRWSGVIWSEPRDGSELKWRVPGGMDGADGWSSVLYRSQLQKAKVALDYAAPSKNDTITWHRTYPDGAIFADVLRNRDGLIFEVRVAEKQGGRWDRYVAYRKESYAPSGYRRLSRQQCADCHEKAGNAEYGGLAIPGGDTILSDPIPIVESGQSVQGGLYLDL